MMLLMTKKQRNILIAAFVLVGITVALGLYSQFAKYEFEGKRVNGKITSETITYRLADEPEYIFVGGNRLTLDSGNLAPSISFGANHYGESLSPDAICNDSAAVFNQKTQYNFNAALSYDDFAKAGYADGGECLVGRTVEAYVSKRGDVEGNTNFYIKLSD
jgi:hypothetical protein